MDSERNATAKAASKKEDPLAAAKHVYWIVCLCFITIVLAAASAIYLFPKVLAVLYPADQALVWFTLTQPQVLAIGDEGVIEVATTSIAQQPISATVLLSFVPPYTVTAGVSIVPIELKAGSTNLFKLDNLAPNEQRTNTTTFQIGLAPQVLHSADTFTPTLQFQIPAIPAAIYNLRPISIWPLPYSRLMITTILAGVAAFTLGLAKDKLKKWVTGSSDKSS